MMSYHCLYEIFVAEFLKYCQYTHLRIHLGYQQPKKIGSGCIFEVISVTKNGDWVVNSKYHQ